MDHLITAPDGSVPHILLADDDPDTLALLGIHLLGAGFRVDVVGDGRTAKHELLRNGHHGGILDHNMEPKGLSEAESQQYKGVAIAAAVRLKRPKMVLVVNSSGFDSNPDADKLRENLQLNRVFLYNKDHGPDGLVSYMISKFAAPRAELRPGDRVKLRQATDERYVDAAYWGPSPDDGHRFLAREYDLIRRFDLDAVDDLSVTQHGTVKKVVYSAGTSVILDSSHPLSRCYSLNLDVAA